MEVASEILSNMSLQDAWILHGQLAGLPDTEVACHVGVSRPTLIKQRRALIGRIHVAARNLEESGREKLMDKLSLSVKHARDRASF